MRSDFATAVNPLIMYHPRFGAGVDWNRLPLKVSREVTSLMRFDEALIGEYRLHS